MHLEHHVHNQKLVQMEHCQSSTLGWIQQGTTMQRSRTRTSCPFRATWNWRATMLWFISQPVPLHSFWLVFVLIWFDLNLTESTGKDGSRHGCCKGQTFDINGHLECCEGQRLVPIGTCLGETTIRESYEKSIMPF